MHLNQFFTVQLLHNIITRQRTSLSQQFISFQQTPPSQDSKAQSPNCCQVHKHLPQLGSPRQAQPSFRLSVSLPNGSWHLARGEGSYMLAYMPSFLPHLQNLQLAKCIQLLLPLLLSPALEHLEGTNYVWTHLIRANSVQVAANRKAFKTHWLPTVIGSSLSNRKRARSCRNLLPILPCYLLS